MVDVIDDTITISTTTGEVPVPSEFPWWLIPLGIAGIGTVYAFSKIKKKTNKRK